MSKKVFWAVSAMFIIGVIGIVSCSIGGSSTSTGENLSEKGSSQVVENKPLNLAVFVDLSDRIEKEKDNMTQSDKDQMIVNGLAEEFVSKQKRDGFQKSEDCFQVVFYPAPEGAQSVADSLSLNLKDLDGPKKRPLLKFQKSHADNIKRLYAGALEAHDYFGSDIWGYFAKDKVKDLCKDGYRNVLVILSDGYIFDQNNKVKEGKNYSYILPQTLAVKDSGLIPCKISNTDLEIYFMECNANPQTDYPKMKNIIECWFKDMGVEIVDVQDTDIPAVTLKHLNKSIFDK